MYDVMVIGGGPGGYMAAQRAGENGLKAVLFEQRSLGGVCLNEGCIPSKSLLNSGKMYEHACDSSVYGVTTEAASIDQKKVVKRKNKVVKQLVAGVAYQMKKNKVDVVEQHAVVKGRSNGILQVEAGGQIYEGKNLIIASGSEPVVPPIPGIREGIDAGRILTSREILDLDVIPKTLVIVGGGVIGLEMASYFQTVGSQVTVIEMLDHIAGTVDRELGKRLQKNYEKKGIQFKLSCKVTGFGDGFVEYEDGGKTEKAEAEYTLLSIGRRAVSANLGLETIGVELERGHIVVDQQCRTSIPNVYAVGDVNGQWMLAHAAYREAEVVVNTILGKRDRMRYEAMPSVIYTNPELAFVGESEESAAAKGLAFKKVTVPLTYSGRYLAEVERGDGMLKLLADPKHQRLLGGHMIGSYASELIIVLGMMIEKEMTLSEIKEYIFPHPTVAEVIREAIFQF